MARTLVISSSDIGRCPKTSMSALHFFRDGAGQIRCRCVIGDPDDRLPFPDLDEVALLAGVDDVAARRRVGELLAG